MAGRRLLFRVYDELGEKIVNPTADAITSAEVLPLASVKQTVHSSPTDRI